MSATFDPMAFTSAQLKAMGAAYVLVCKKLPPTVPVTRAMIADTIIQFVKEQTLSGSELADQVLLKLYPPSSER